MSYITISGSKQYIVDEGQKFAVDHLKHAKEGDILELPVLHTFGDSKNSKTLKVKVVSHLKGDKIRVVKYKSKSNYHRQYGFRPLMTVLEVISEAIKATKKTEEKVAPAKKETKEKAETKAAPAKTAAKKSTVKKSTKEEEI